MKTPRHRWWIGLLALLMLILLGTTPLQAAPPLQGPRWLPFDDAAAPAPPILTLRAADAAQIDLAAELPGCTAEDVPTGGSTWTRLSGDGYGHPAEIGRPDLPVLRRDVEIPWGTEVTLEIVSASFRDSSLAALGLHPLYPLQPPVPKVDGAEDRPLAMDRAAYQAGLVPAAPVRLGEAYIVRGHRIQPVEVWPMAYDPQAGTVRLYDQVAFRLVLRGSDMAQTAALAARYASPVFEQGLSDRVLNYHQGRPPAPTADVGYLVITADAYYDAILPLANLRESRGFDVTVTRCSEIGGGCLDAAAIKAYIQNAYDTWPLPPSYVLLVGDTDTVATWTGPVIGTSTDLYYGTMDGSGDWHPDIGRGRFPVRSPEQTTIMVDKYLAYGNLTGQEPWVKKDAFVATCDLYQIAEGTHNYVIDSYTLPKGYSGNFPNNPQPGGDKLYCITYGATKADMNNSFNDGRLMIIYSGHGAHTGWEVGNYGPGDVRALLENGVSAFVASHACLTGDFGVMPEVFGETWVLQPNKGGLVFWGSSTNSFWDEDDVLERVMFDSYFTPTVPHPDVWTMTDYGLAGVEAAYPSSAQYYRETYNVLGDPAVKIFIEPDLPTFLLNVEPQEHEVCQTGTVTSSVEIGSIMGYSKTVDLEVAGAPAGITVTLAPSSAPAPYTATLTLEVGPGAPAGDYTLLVTATDHISWTNGAEVVLYVRPAAPAAPLLTTPPDGAPDQPLAPTMGWDAAPYAGTYNVQLDSTPAFAAPLLDVSGLTGTSYTTPNPLAGGRCYWWRAQGENLCGTGDWAVPFHFATVALGYAFYDDVESGNQGWTPQLPWAITHEASHSPSHSWTDSPGTQYRDNTNVALTSGVLNLSAYDSVALGFWHAYETEAGYDYCHVEYSVDGGETWAALTTYDGTGPWAYEEFDVPALANQANVRIRFRLTTDGSVTADGWHIDDIRVIVPLAPNPAPLVTDVIPRSGTPWDPTPVHILGSGFVETPNAMLEGTWLLSVTLVSSTTLDAVVPAGMAPGTYDLTLYNGDCQEAVLPDAFAVVTQCITPTVELAAGSPVELGEPMPFTATVEGTPEFSYTWAFGGPGYGVGLDTAAPVYTYTAPGNFTATVQATNHCGVGDTHTNVEVQCAVPQASFESDSPVPLGAPMHFTATASGTGPFTYTWDFGDGSPPSTGGTGTVYTYTTAGNYTVTLAVEGPCGMDIVTAAVQVLAGCEAPLAGFVSSSPIELGRAMLFTSTISGTGPFTYTWDFGDGVGASGDPHPVYTYTVAGTFTVTLSVQGHCGTDTAMLAVTVLPGQEVYRFYLPLMYRNCNCSAH